MEEEDVILEGSPLHEEFKERGLTLDEITPFRGRSSESVWPLEETSPTDDEEESSALKEETARLCTTIATKILESSLLVVEDEDFISNFVLSESDHATKSLVSSSDTSSSSLGNVLFYSCSIAAVAGTLLLLSDRTKMTAATIATLVPAGIAAIASGPSLFKRPKPSEEFLRVLSNLLEDMKVFKVLARKTLSLLQGMELLQTNAALPPINALSGGMEANGSPVGPSSFPALRSAAYKCTVDLIRAYRGAMRTLLEVNPLDDHIDYQEHYIAFVELERFQIAQSAGPDLPSIKGLKDAVQLALIQQSEYLRRFSLTFCEKAKGSDKKKKLSKAGVLRQIHELAATIKKINKKLSSVFEYHQAMGMIQEEENPQGAPRHLRLQRSLVPLKSIYSSLFSSGLHLQNSLLKVRQLEKIFDSIDLQRRRSKPMHLKHQEDEEETLPSEDQLLLWHNGFKEIQKELEACVGCLEDGASHIDSIKNKSDSSEPSPSNEKEEPMTTTEEVKTTLIPETDVDTVDEVFEADMVAGGSCSKEEEEKGRASLLTEEELRRRKAESRVLEELKSVLSSRSLVQERREAEALAKKKGLISPCMEKAEVERAIASQVCSLGVVSPVSSSNKNSSSIQSVDIQEKLIKNELAKVMEEINDIEEEIIKTDLSLPCEGGGDCLSSSSDTDSNCSRDTIKSIREKKRESTVFSPEKDLNGYMDPSEEEEEEGGSSIKSLRECLRSISTPDLQSGVPECGSSVYRTIESSNSSAQGDPTPDRDSDPGSADEMENRMLKVYRRPLRPAALKKMKSTPNGLRNRGSYLSKKESEDLFIPPPPDSVLGGAASTNSFVSQIRAKAAAFRIALDSEKVFGGNE